MYITFSVLVQTLGSVGRHSSKDVSKCLVLVCVRKDFPSSMVLPVKKFLLLVMCRGLSDTVTTEVTEHFRVGLGLLDGKNVEKTRIQLQPPLFYPNLSVTKYHS